MKKEHVSEAEAKTLMKENDRERQSYFRFWTKKIHETEKTMIWN